MDRLRHHVAPFGSDIPGVSGMPVCLTVSVIPSTIYPQAA